MVVAKPISRGFCVWKPQHTPNSAAQILHGVLALPVFSISKLNRIHTEYTEYLYTEWSLSTSSVLHLHTDSSMFRLLMRCLEYEPF